ncbi:iron complex transport system permease protein [Limimaricola pyoseonensis]|uniref:Iron complex transport system permease protein n=1 Tax=Limimaricola pyoseonensis TaxID=521013 RepID=A0A1G7G2A6_9RHOB|nr:iron chelate uptake ABC transporter family permease subunit [Limimaricola pyoseonensis]SDE82185.1 iron complex transport system permease protein [Limimaricola pyoseonensis]
MIPARLVWPAAALLALAAGSLFTGVVDLGPGALRDPEALRLIWISRWPRTLAVLLTGASMAVAGLILQMLARNRFVEPATAGTGQAAALGILGVTLLWPGAPLWAQMGLSSLAALVGSVVFLALIRQLPPTRPLLVPLVALIYGGILGAGVDAIGWQFDLLQYVAIWTNGEFSGVMRGRYELLWLTGALTLLAYLYADRFTIAGLGRDAATGLGLNHGRVVAAGLLIVSIATAVTVVTIGTIPFVGLVVPNIVSRMAGDNLRATLPGTAAFGAGLVLACDIAARLLRHPYETPVGTIFGVVGAALFLWLLHAKPRHAR